MQRYNCGLNLIKKGKNRTVCQVTHLHDVTSFKCEFISQSESSMQVSLHVLVKFLF